MAVRAFFELKKYFTAEASRLGAQHTLVTKTVTYDKQTETQSILVKNWQHELALFTASDINKPAWRESYNVMIKGDSAVYKAIDTNLKTRYVLIIKNGDKVKKISIINVTRNLLYQTNERLTYIPDSIYHIEKSQTVRILGNSDYVINGKFDKLKRLKL